MAEQSQLGPRERHRTGLRRAQASINVAAIERNCARLRTQLHAGTALCAVVKADGYGHGAVQSARAALAGGASLAGASPTPPRRASCARPGCATCGCS